MPSNFKLEIVTPDKKFFEGDVEQIVVRTTQGDMGILKDHMLMVSPLGTGVLKIKQAGEDKEAACAGGFIQVKKDKTTIITDAIEWPKDVDVTRAKQALKRAEQRLDSNDEDVDKKRAQNAKKRAMTRLLLMKEIQDAGDR